MYLVLITTKLRIKHVHPIFIAIKIPALYQPRRLVPASDQCLSSLCHSLFAGSANRKTTLYRPKSNHPLFICPILILFIAGCAYLLTLRLDKFRPQTAFVGLINRLSLSWPSSKVLPCLSLLAFSCWVFAVYAKLSWEKNKYRQFLPLGLPLTFPKVAYLVYHPAVIDLQRFVIDNSSSGISTASG